MHVTHFVNYVCRQRVVIVDSVVRNSFSFLEESKPSSILCRVARINAKSASWNRTQNEWSIASGEEMPCVSFGWNFMLCKILSGLFLIYNFWGISHLLKTGTFLHFLPMLTSLYFYYRSSLKRIHWVWCYDNSLPKFIQVSVMLWCINRIATISSVHCEHFATIQ